ncbi:RE1-silencing transcription factor-like [Myxocyprinus asiaticus]|uniref:RE1-silencing transcription factor-like n=1 Tax=Myxocyprinus asiaticus TaxID=70543 RepID=UPI002223C8CA|nr:RE1-silencing transcription factor-like [Myxocyprinus asiaticus]
MSAQTVYPATAGIFMPSVGIPLPGEGHDLPELSRNDLAAPQLVMLANVVLASETSPSEYNAEEIQMVELKTVGCNSYSDSEEEGIIRYTLDNTEMSEDMYAEQATRVEPEVTERVLEQSAIERAENRSKPSEKYPSESSAAEKRKCDPVFIFECNKKKKKPFFCKPCQYQADCEEDFIHHIRAHSSKKMSVANGAGDSNDDLACESGQSLTETPENSESLNYKGVISCERCGYNTNRYDHYIAHLKHHTKEGEDQRVFKCTICTYTTISQYHWKKHLRNHFPSKLFTCSQCSYFSDRKNNYIQHIRTHTGERPFKCIYCEYSSSQKTHLTRHMRTHSGERPFKCDNCSYLAANQHEVTRHARQVHNGPKPLSCPYCQYKTADRSNFKKHVELHVNPRQFLCPVCKYAASKKCNLQYHIKSRHPGYSDVDVSKVKLRVKRPDADDLPPNKNNKLVINQVGERQSKEEEKGEMDDTESGPINLSIKTPSKPTPALETELTDRTSKKNAVVICREKNGKPIQQPNEKTAEKKSILKNEGKEKNSKKVKAKTLEKVADITTTQTEGCTDKQDNKKEKEIKKIERSVEKVKKRRAKKDKPLKETANEVTAQHQTLVAEKQRLELVRQEKERLENDLVDKEQQEKQDKEEKNRLEKEKQLQNEKVKETDESTKDCRESQTKKLYKRQTKSTKVDTGNDTKSTEEVQEVRTKPVKRKAEAMNIPGTETSEQKCPSKRVKSKKKNATKLSPGSSGSPQSNRTIPQGVNAMKSKSKNPGTSANRPESCVTEPEKTSANIDSNAGPENLTTPQTDELPTTEPLKVLDQPDQQIPTVVTCQDEGVHKETSSVEEEPTVGITALSQLQDPELELLKETEGRTSAEPKEVLEVDSGSEMLSPTNSESCPGFSQQQPVFSPTLELSGPPHLKSTEAEDDEGIHSNDGGSDISDSASEGSNDSGLNGLAAARDGGENLPETPSEELPSSTKLLSHTCIFCDRIFSLEMDYRRHLNRHLVNVYYLEGAAQVEK